MELDMAQKPKQKVYKDRFKTKTGRAKPFVGKAGYSRFRRNYGNGGQI